MGTPGCYLLQQNAGLLGRTSATGTYHRAGKEEEEEEEPKHKNIHSFLCHVMPVIDKNCLKYRDTFVARLEADYSSYRAENTVGLLQQPAALCCSF
jgi:hypothetical protein